MEPAPRPVKSPKELILDLVTFDNSFSERLSIMECQLINFGDTDKKWDLPPDHVIRGLKVKTTAGKDLMFIVTYNRENAEETRQIMNRPQRQDFLPIGSRCTVSIDPFGNITYTYTTPRV